MFGSSDGGGSVLTSSSDTIDHSVIATNSAVSISMTVASGATVVGAVGSGLRSSAAIVSIPTAAVAVDRMVSDSVGGDGLIELIT